MFPSVLDWNLLLSEFEGNNFELLEEYLKHLRCNLLELADDQGFTLLHHAVLKGTAGKTDQVFDLVTRLNTPDKAQIEKWVNLRSIKD